MSALDVALTAVLGFLSSLASLEAFAVNDYFTDAKITPVVRRLSRKK